MSSTFRSGHGRCSLPSSSCNDRACGVAREQRERDGRTEVVVGSDRVTPSGGRRTCDRKRGDGQLPRQTRCGTAQPPEHLVVELCTRRGQRLLDRPDRRWTDECSESERRRDAPTLTLDDTELARGQRQPLEQGNPHSVVHAAAEPHVTAVVYDERCDPLQATLGKPGKPADRSFESHRRHALEARPSPGGAQDALSDMSAGAFGLDSPETLTKERHDVVGLGVVPEHRLREHELTVQVNVEDAARAGHDLDRADLVFQLLENPHRQTGGVRQRASGNAVLDPDVGPCCHAPIQSLMPPVPFGRCEPGTSASPTRNNCPQRAHFPCTPPLTQHTTPTYVG